MLRGFHRQMQQLCSWPTSATCPSTIRTTFQRSPLDPQRRDRCPNGAAPSQPPEEWRSLGPLPWELHNSQPSGEALCAAGLHLPSISPCWQPTDQIADPRASWHKRVCPGTIEQRIFIKAFHLAKDRVPPRSQRLIGFSLSASFRSECQTQLYRL